ncbi:MAG: serine/threonine protein kinase, partial [Chloroflexota bacterium]
MANVPKNVGRYKIEEEIGKGGMAKVYTAYDPNVKRNVALKLMSTHLTDDEEFRARFRREAEAVAALEHVGIVPIYDFGEDDDQLYIVMRLMGGGTLKDKINAGPLSIEEAAKTLRRIALALDKAHENGIIHRDLKPGNILYDQDEEGYIADFGVAHLAKSGEELTGTGALIGTPAYMSPEQVRGANDEVDGRSDIYSLGVILFEMLSGSVPYNSDTPMGTALMHLLEPVPRVLDSNPNLPPTIEEIIDTAMAKEKEDRYDKAKDMADALDEVIAGSYMPTQKLQDGDKIKEIVATQKPRGKKRVVFGMLFIVIVTVVAFILFQGGRPASDTNDQSNQDGAVAIGEEASPTIIPTEADATEIDVPVEEATEEPTEIPAVNLVEMSLSNIGQVSLAGILGRGTINEIVISPGGDVVAVAGSLGVWLYDAETLDLISHFEPSDGSLMNSLAWSPDTEGLRIVTGGEDGKVRIWNPTTGQQLLKIDAHLEPINSVDWSPDGDMIASGSADNTVKFWNPATGNPRFTFEGHLEDVTNVMWSPDGTRFVSSGWTVNVWDVSRQLLLVTLGGHTDQIESMVWSPDGTQLISASRDSTMRVWNVASADLITPVEGQETPVYGVSWSPNGEYVVQSAGKDVLVRNPEMGIETILEGHSANTTHFAWLENGDKLLSVSSAGEM